MSAIADSVDALIAAAVEGRPDLAAARAQARAAQSHVVEVRANLLPALTLNANTGRTYTSTIPNGSNTYTLSLGLNIPIFSGFSRQYDLREAEWLAQAARAQAEGITPPGVDNPETYHGARGGDFLGSTSVGWLEAYSNEMRESLNPTGALRVAAE